jgi:hypothetical protein
MLKSLLQQGALSQPHGVLCPPCHRFEVAPYGQGNEIMHHHALGKGMESCNQE